MLEFIEVGYFPISRFTTYASLWIIIGDIGLSLPLNTEHQER